MLITCPVTGLDTIKPTRLLHMNVRSGVIESAGSKIHLPASLSLHRVIVMDKGHISEMDSPANLIAQRGQFYRMCREAGLI